MQGNKKSPEEESIAQPHDAFFKRIFSEREHAVGLLRTILPDALCASVQWSELRTETGSFVDEDLRSRHSDLVLSAPIGDGRAIFYTLLEHQRSSDDLMPLRFGVYMMRLWEKLQRDQPNLRKIPPILPILIHHSDSGWCAPTAFQDIIDRQGIDKAAWTAIERHVPAFEFQVLDLSRGRAGLLVDGALTALGRVALWCMSIVDDDARFEREIVRLIDVLDEMVRAPNGLAALGVILRYLTATHSVQSAKKVSKLLKETASEQVKETVVTYLDELKLQGRAEMLLELLTARFGQVPSDAKKRVRAAVKAFDEASLSQWSLRTLTAQTLKDVLIDTPKTKASRPKSAASRRPKGA